MVAFRNVRPILGGWGTHFVIGSSPIGFVVTG